MKGKKLLFLSLFFALMLVVGGVIGCGAEEEPTAPANGTTTPTTKPTVTPPPDAETFVWKWASTRVPGHQNYDRDMVTKDHIETMSGGRLTFDYYEGGSLLASREIFDGLATGTADIGGVASVYVSGFVLCGDIDYSVDWALSNLADYQYVYWEAEPRCWEDIYREEVGKHGVFVLTTGPDVPYGALPSTKPIRTADDFKGKKIRSYGLTAKVIESFGASIVTLDSAEMYTALALGTIDASTWVGARSTYDKSLHEVAKYYIMPHSLPWCESGKMASPKAFDALPADLQEILLRASREHIARGATVVPYENAKYLRIMVDEAGVEVITLPQESQDRMRAACFALLDDYKDDPPSWEMIEILKDLMRVKDIPFE
jgi:TRAP-type mannitol/chloroaromatic compound transport system substrate-binding protein